MSNPATFITNYVANIQQLTSLLQTLRGQNDQLTEDPTLITRYFSLTGARSDIVAADVTNAKGALVQVLFSYDSGAPTQKSFLFKMLP